MCLCFQVVSLLLCQGADPNARDNWNYTPLHEAAIKGKIDVCIGGGKGTSGERLCAFCTNERLKKHIFPAAREPGVFDANTVAGNPPQWEDSVLRSKN